MKINKITLRYKILDNKKYNNLKKNMKLIEQKYKNTNLSRFIVEIQSVRKIQSVKNIQNYNFKTT